MFRGRLSQMQQEEVEMRSHLRDPLTDRNAIQIEGWAGDENGTPYRSRGGRAMRTVF